MKLESAVTGHHEYLFFKMFKSEMEGLFLWACYLYKKLAYPEKFFLFFFTFEELMDLIIILIDYENKPQMQL